MHNFSRKFKAMTTLELVITIAIMGIFLSVSGVTIASIVKLNNSASGLKEVEQDSASLYESIKDNFSSFSNDQASLTLENEVSYTFTISGTKYTSTFNSDKQLFSYWTCVVNDDQQYVPTEHKDVEHKYVKKVSFTKSDNNVFATFTMTNDAIHRYLFTKGGSSL